MIFTFFLIEILPILHKKQSFSLRISSVNVTKSAVSCGFGHIYWRNPEWKTSFGILNRKTFLFEEANTGTFKVDLSPNGL